MKPMLTTGHTETAQGVIAHLRVGGGELRAPVKMDYNKPRSDSQGAKRYHPLVRGGRYVHALPAGGEMLGSFVG